jgi:hypothetical protein
MESNPPYKVLGFMSIHYGLCYLKESLGSIKDHVDKMVIAYSKLPSHGYQGNEVCPDSEEDIYKICSEVLGDKLIWDRAESYPNEATHRDVKYKYLKLIEN